MDYITYSLNNNNINSNLYYEKAEFINNKVIENIIKSNKLYIDDFMKFIKENKIEYIRSIVIYA